MSQPADLDLDAPPEINLAAFAAVHVIDLSGAAQPVDARSLAQNQTEPVAIVPGNGLLLEWNHPRNVRALRLEFDGSPPAPEDLRIAWWRRIWPDNGSGGWMKLDDPFNGQWTPALFDGKSLDAVIRCDFKPLSTNAAPGIRGTGFPFRQTYKLLLTSHRTITLKHLDVFSDALRRQARLRFEWNVQTKVPGSWSPKFEARNGRVLKTASAGRNASIVEVEYADVSDRLSNDRGYVICRSGETRSFSVFVDDVLREGGIFVRDIGAFVSDASRNHNFKAWSGPSGEAWRGGTVIEQVSKMPEQSFEQVAKVIPAKPPPYLFLGVPHVRQEIALLSGGEIQLRADSLRTPGPEHLQRPWKWEDLTYQFGSGERPVMGQKHRPQIKRELHEGWLPVVRHEWHSDGIEYVQDSLATLLVGDLSGFQSHRGTETLVAVNRFEMRNSSTSPRTAWLWIELNHHLPARLSVDGTLLLDHPSDGEHREGLVPVRGHFETYGKGSLDLAPLIPSQPGSLNPAFQNSSQAREAVRYRVDLAPGESHRIEFQILTAELLSRDELKALKRHRFSDDYASVRNFWNERVGRGMTYEVPDRYLNDFFKANLWHVLISTDIDPDTGQFQHGAATHRYKNFLNETMMVARALEMRGEHAEAARLIETFLANQSVKGLPGNFRSRHGVFYAAHPSEPDPYTAQGYNMHHGFGLWGAAEHYFWTRDEAYLRRVADALITACDWITTERQATQRLDRDGSRPVEFGLAPAGDLEDVEEYHYFYATDAYYYLGMKTAADALAAMEHPEAPRLAKAAEEFRKDIRSSVAESVATTPVVRLRDGSYIPYVPPRVHALTHRKEGWIREGLYPALHLHAGRVFPANHPFVDWMIQDLEDNISLSSESGFGISNPEKQFFHRGGMTLQPNLLNLAVTYLDREQPAHFLRAFYNTAWASLYPDVLCFAEWLPELGKGGGPLYKTPDECQFIQWMRQMLVLERDGSLELGAGIPRAWLEHGQRIKVERAATLFGSLDLEIISDVAMNQARASVQLRPSRPIQSLRLRIPHPAGKKIQKAQVNGRKAGVDESGTWIDLPVKEKQWETVIEFE
ncbi:MAG: hypothetical protein AB1813_08595 [Verrucomicrobiota bacterium]